MDKNKFNKPVFIEDKEAWLKVCETFLNALPQIREVIAKFDKKIINARFETALREVLVDKSLEWHKRPIGTVNVEKYGFDGRSASYRLVAGDSGRKHYLWFRFTVRQDDAAKLRIDSQLVLSELDDYVCTLAKQIAEDKECIDRYDEFAAVVDGIREQIQASFQDCPDSLWYHLRREGFESGALYLLHKPRK